MPLVPSQVNAFLKGIENHARARNFDQVSIQTNILLEEMVFAIHQCADESFEYRKALPSVRALLPDSTRSDTRSAVEHVRRAQLALGFHPE